MRLDKWSDDIKDKVFTQDYTPAGRIDGVRIEELKVFTDDGGFFLEVGRLTEKGKFDWLPELDIKQMNYSEIQPGVIKAWHMHPDQNEVWFVPPTQRVLVGFYDARKGSDTEGKSMRFVLGAGRARLVYIPAGVAHGLANPYSSPAHMMYFVSEQFNPNPEEGQEYRLPWDVLGKDFWELDKG